MNQPKIFTSTLLTLGQLTDLLDKAQYFIDIDKQSGKRNVGIIEYLYWGNIEIN